VLTDLLDYLQIFMGDLEATVSINQRKLQGYLRAPRMRPPCTEHRLPLQMPRHQHRLSRLRTKGRSYNIGEQYLEVLFSYHGLFNRFTRKRNRIRTPIPLRNFPHHQLRQLRHNNDRGSRHYDHGVLLKKLYGYDQKKLYGYGQKKPYGYGPKKLL
jgi:hypothetical protein